MKINILPNQSKLTSYTKLYEVRRILLLGTAVKAKMLTFVLPTEKRLKFHFRHF